MNQRKKILFITGTRADYGKIKPIMQKMEKKQKEYEVFVYVSGMHLLQKYGSTYREVQKDGYKNTYVAFEQVMTDNMSYNLGVVLMNLARYAEQIKPDIDIMLSDTLPSLQQAYEKYEVDFDTYSIFMYHPVTTEIEKLPEHIGEVVDALLASEKNYIVVYPNNDNGTEVILNEIGRLYGNKRFRVFPSIRFEYFLTFLKNADAIIGNSSAGIRESGIYGIPAIDIGSRQKGRYDEKMLKNIQHAREDKADILDKLQNISSHRIPSSGFGVGNSTELFFEVLKREDIWNLDIQKIFVDIRGLKR